MQGIELLKLDVRLIDHLYGRKYFVPKSVKKNDLALFYRDNSNMKVLLIENGGRIFKKAIRSVFGKYGYKPPTIEQAHYEILQHMLSTQKPEHIRYPEDKFRTMAEQFVRTYALGRLESQVMSAQVYNKSNGSTEPCIDQTRVSDDLVQKLQEETITNLELLQLPKTPEAVYRKVRIQLMLAQMYDKNNASTGLRSEEDIISDYLVRKLQQEIITNPELLHLPKTPKVAYREVRLNNRFSRCVGIHSDYSRFREGIESPNSCITECDLVPHFSDTEFCLVEVKAGSSLNSKTIEKGKAELVKGSLFYQNQENFQNPNLLVMAVLKLGSRKKNFTVYHFQYDGQKLKHMETFPPTPYDLGIPLKPPL